MSVPTLNASLPLTDWIDAQASYYKSLDTDGGKLIGAVLSGLSRDVSHVQDAGRPIGVREFLARLGAICWEKDTSPPTVTVMLHELEAELAKSKALDCDELAHACRACGCEVMQAEAEDVTRQAQFRGAATEAAA